MKSSKNFLKDSLIMKRKSLVFFALFLFLIVNLNGQILLRKISWNGDKEEIMIDSVLTVPFKDIFLPMTQNMQHALDGLPLYMYDLGINAKVYLLYNEEVLIKNSPRTRKIKEFDKLLSDVSDSILTAIFPYLRLNFDTIYMLSILIAYDIKIGSEGRTMYFIQYEAEKERFGDKRYNIITIRGYPVE